MAALLMLLPSGMAFAQLQTDPAAPRSFACADASVEDCQPPQDRNLADADAAATAMGILNWPAETYLLSNSGVLDIREAGRTREGGVITDVRIGAVAMRYWQAEPGKAIQSAKASILCPAREEQKAVSVNYFGRLNADDLCEALQAEAGQTEGSADIPVRVAAGLGRFVRTKAGWFQLLVTQRIGPEPAVAAEVPGELPDALTGARAAFPFYVSESGALVDYSGEVPLVRAPGEVLLFAGGAVSVTVGEHVKGRDLLAAYEQTARQAGQSPDPATVARLRGNFEAPAGMPLWLSLLFAAAGLFLIAAAIWGAFWLAQEAQRKKRHRWRI